VSFRLRLSPRAIDDLARLPEFVRLSNPLAAVRVRTALVTALASLAEFPDRGRPLRSGLRELPVRLGRYGYLIRYRVGVDEVFVTRLRHVRERR
jgi:toxin ParE1/3/4